MTIFTENGHLRLICTTDLHMALNGSALLNDEIRGQGLAALAPAIASARAEVASSLVFDVGDALQGSPLTDDLRPEDGHPMQQAFDLIGYDAQTVGNHDLDFGLDYLQAARGDSDIPLISANLLTPTGEPIFDPFRILELPFEGEILRVGITGTVPPRVMRWNKHHLADRARVSDAVQAVREVLPAMRMAGADIVVVLAHCGIVPLDDEDLDEQSALPIAMIDGVDVVICGHQHRMFPGVDFPSTEGIDPIAGTLAGTPAIMAGWAGQRIGVLDLSLARPNGYWQVEAHKASFRRGLPEPDARIDQIAAPHVARTRARLDKQISATSRPLSTLFSAVGDCSAVRAVSAAYRDIGQRMLQTDLPVLAISAPLRCGGRSGPRAYTHIAPGVLSNRAVADLCPFENRVIGVTATGAQLLDWLEMASIHLGHLHADSPGQILINPAMPGYNFDAVLGLNYTLDPTQPHHFSASGTKLGAVAHLPRRVGDVTFEGRALDPAQRFAVVANNYRVAGGGNFPGMDQLDLLAEDLGSMSEIVTKWVQGQKDGIALPPPSWRIKPAFEVQASFRTGQGSPELDELHPHLLLPAGTTPDGWHDWDITLRP